MTEHGAESEGTPTTTTRRARPRRVQLPATVLAGLALLTVVAGCGDDDSADSGSDSGDEQTPSASDDSSPPPTPPAGISINVGTWAAGEPGMDAALSGTVQISSTGCIVVQPSGKSAEHVDVLWPVGTVLVQVGTDPIEVRDAEGATVARIGTRLQVSGGEVDDTRGQPGLECDAGGDTSAFAITEELTPLPGG